SPPRRSSDLLKNAEPADPVGAVTILPQAQQTPLHPDQQCGNDDNTAENAEGDDQLDQFVEKPAHGAISTGSCRPCTCSWPTGTPMVLSGRLASICTGRVAFSLLMVSSRMAASATPRAAAAAEFLVKHDVRFDRRVILAGAL